MARQTILAAVRSKDEVDFLEDYFSETRSQLIKLDAKTSLESALSKKPKIVIVESPLLSASERAGISHYLGGDGRIGLEIGTEIAVPVDSGGLETALFKKINFPDTLRILVIDDEPEVCFGIRDFLELRRRPSFAVDYALNGLEGFGKIESMNPDVTILDIKMPVKSGYDLYREIHKKNRDRRIIILTAAVGPDEIAEIRKIGSPVFVDKGARRSSFPELLSLIKKEWAFS
jgi:CheY-like chemotaxis protein